MEELDRRAAVAVKTLEREDMRTLITSAARIATKVDALVAAQDEEIFRLRRLIVAATAAYREIKAKNWKGGAKRWASFVDSMDRLALETDAIFICEDLPPKRRIARRRA